MNPGNRDMEKDCVCGRKEKGQLVTGTCNFCLWKLSGQKWEKGWVGAVLNGTCSQKGKNANSNKWERSD